MATLVVQGLGIGALLPFPLGLIATVAAAYIDSRYIYPALFKADDEVQPQSLAGMDLMTADKGSPRVLAFGRFAVVQAHVHWMSEDRQETSGHGNGGKGAGNQRTYLHQVRADIACTFNNIASDGISRLSADQEVLWANPRNWVVYFDHRMVVTAAGGVLTIAAAEGFDFGMLFKAGDRLKLSRFSTNNGYWLVTDVDLDTSTGLYQLRLATLDGLTAASATAGTANDPAQIERVDDAFISPDVWTYRQTLAPGGLMVLAADYSQADAILKVGNEVVLENWEPANRDVKAASTAISVDATTKRFTLASGNWTSPPVVGQFVQTSGFANGTNNGVFLVTAVTLTTFDVFETVATESAGSTATIVALSMLGGNRWKMLARGSGPPFFIATGLQVTSANTIITSGTWPLQLQPGMHLSLTAWLTAQNNIADVVVVSATASTVMLATSALTPEGPITGVGALNLIAAAYWLVPMDGQVAPSVEHVGRSATDVPRIRLSSPILRQDVIEDLQVHLGTDHDVPDSTIEAVEGVGNVPAFRGRLWALLRNFNKTEFGNRTPQIEAVVRRHPFEKVAGLLVNLFWEANFFTFDIDPELHDLPLWGYSVRGPQALVSLLQPLAIAYDFLAQERAGLTYFFLRKNAETWVVDPADLGAISDGAGSVNDQPLTITDGAASKMPTRVELAFKDLNNDFQQGSQGYGLRHPGREESQESVTRIDLQPLVSDAFSMKKRARELLYATTRNAVAVETMLPPSYIHLIENDFFSTTDPATGEPVLARITSMEEGANYALRVGGVLDEVQGRRFGTTVHRTPPPVNGGSPPTMLRAFVLDIASPTNDALTQPGLFFVAASRPGGQWRGAQVFESRDNGANWNEIALLSTEHTVGSTTTALATGPIGLWQAASVTIALDGELFAPFSVTRADVLRGINWFLIGDEILGASTVTQNLDGTYTLSDLLRGIRDTTAAVGTHAAGERVVMMTGLTSGGIFRELPGGVADIGSVRKYRFVAAGELLADAEEFEVTLAGNNARPFAPTGLAVARDGSNNATIAWEPRSRAIVPLLPPGPIPLYERDEVYEVEILDGFGTVVRVFHLTSVGTGSPSVAHNVLYPATGAGSQTADGLTPGVPIHFRIYQVGAVGRGNAAEDTL